MRILFIPYVLPPLHYPAALRNLKLLLGLSRCAVEIEVCHVDPAHYRHFGPEKLDTELADKLPSNVRYLPVNSNERSPFYKFINANPTISRFFYFWTNPIKREWTWAAETLLKRNDPTRYDAVVTLSQPHCNHLIGLWLKKKYNVPWISYFSDPWIDNQYSNLSTDKFLRSYHSKLERSVMTLSDRVLFTSEETRQLLLTRYPNMSDKFSVLQHCYVPQWHPRAKNSKQDHPITMLHCGNFYGPRSALPVLEILAELEKNLGISQKLRLELVGGIQDKDRMALSKLGISHFVHCKPTVPYLESLALQAEADWLLLVDAPSTQGPSVFLPSKLIDYLGSEKPILGVTPKEGASARVLKETGHPVHDMMDHEALKNRFIQIADGWKPETNSKSNQYSVDEIGKLFYDYLLNI